MEGFPWTALFTTGTRTRTIMMLPLIYAVRRKNIYIGMIAHVMVNIVSVLGQA
jgi:hypothetical protein